MSDAQLASLDDAHLAAVIQAIDDRTARVARVGETRGTAGPVRRFAHDVIETQIKFQARLSQLGIEPASGPVSDQVSTETEGGLATLRRARGEALDRAYVDQQLRDLTWAADLIDRAAGYVRSPELKEAVVHLQSRLEINARQATAIRERQD